MTQEYYFTSFSFETCQAGGVSGIFPKPRIWHFSFFPVVTSSSSLYLPSVFATFLLRCRDTIFLVTRNNIDFIHKIQTGTNMQHRSGLGSNGNEVVTLHSPKLQNWNFTSRCKFCTIHRTLLPQSFFLSQFWGSANYCSANNTDSRSKLKITEYHYHYMWNTKLSKEILLTIIITKPAHWTSG